MLSDKATIEVRAGAGGNGCVSFRREAHVPKGGPDGGAGGQGGDVVLRCDDSMRDLQSFRHKAHFRAKRGGHGEGSRRSGADGETLIVPVPPGTQILGWDGRRYDLVEPGSQVTIARGGKGGKGNKAFTTAVRQAPRLAQLGLPGEEGTVDLQLKLLADVGLVGLPNAGKSSLLSRLTRAQPKIAAYPFTTLEPVLGTIELNDRQLVVADIPGLIEGASQGAGLGHDFLAHIERTRALIHVLDLAPVDGSDPEENFAVIEQELVGYEPRLALLPRILVLSKADLVPAEEADRISEEWRERIKAWGDGKLVGSEGEEVPVLVTSSATHQGISELTQEIGRVAASSASIVERTGGVSAVDGEAQAEYQVFTPGRENSWEVEKVGPNAFRVDGPAVKHLLDRYDTANEEALAYIEHRLNRIGVIGALQQEGFQPGDELEIAGMKFELDPDS